MASYGFSRNQILSYLLSKVALFVCLFYNSPSDVAMLYECGCEVYRFFAGLQLSASSNS